MAHSLRLTFYSFPPNSKQCRLNQSRDLSSIGPNEQVFLSATFRWSLRIRFIDSVTFDTSRLTGIPFGQEAPGRKDIQYTAHRLKLLTENPP
ncbi:hypothetical protein COLO4_03231 [Corchorus olitorius]|uniref:Uncharacterized protein n=1 Tax=Corchorus olitorius TaxID=93759 RepID=A0A1R3KZ88_9ROSI|nr:hypothetical protein COLO4_03231 [Corchorus olitorius]